MVFIFTLLQNLPRFLKYLQNCVFFPNYNLNNGTSATSNDVLNV